MGNNMYRRPGPPPRPPRPESQRTNSASCEELLRAIAEADFFAQDLKLYLDTHPDDKRAVEMYAEACRQYMACKAAFEDSFYPANCKQCGQGRMLGLARRRLGAVQVRRRSDVCF